MAIETVVIQMLANQSGRICTQTGTQVAIKFSLYRYQEVSFVFPGAKSAGGYCRVSDGSDVLEGVFHAGLPVLLTSPELEATIRLTSPTSFEVIGPVTEKGQPEAAVAPAPFEAEGRPRQEEERKSLSSYRWRFRSSQVWRKEEKSSGPTFAGPQAFPGAGFSSRFRSAK